MTTFIVFFCFNCDRIEYGLLGVKLCPHCAGKIKYLKSFFSKEEAKNYANYMKARFSNQI